MPEVEVVGRMVFRRRSPPRSEYRVQIKDIQRITDEAVSRLVKELRPGNDRQLLTLNQLAACHLPRLTSHLVCPTDLTIAWQLHLLPHLGNETEATLTKERVEEVLGEMVCGPRTFNKTRWAGMRVLERARKHGDWEAKNLFEMVEPKPLTDRNVRILSPAELRLVFQFAKPHRKALFAAAFYTGARKGELFAWRRKNINLAQGLLDFRGSHGRNTTKNGSHRVSLPLHEELAPFLEEQLASHESDWVFPGLGGQRLHKGTHVERELRSTLGRAGVVQGYDCRCRRCGHSERHKDAVLRHCDACGMKLWPVAAPIHVWFHDLRHSAVTLLQEAGVPRSVVKLLVGHGKRPRTEITDSYTHHTERYVREMVNRVRLFGGSDSPFDYARSLRTSNPKVGGSTPSGRISLAGDQGLRTAPEVAALLRVSRETVYRLVARGQLACVRVGAVLRFSLADVETYLAGGLR